MPLKSCMLTLLVVICTSALAADGGDTSAVANKLQELQRMKAQGLITPEDYERTKAALLGSFVSSGAGAPAAANTRAEDRHKPGERRTILLSEDKKWPWETLYKLELVWIPARGSEPGFWISRRQINLLMYNLAVNGELGLPEGFTFPIIDETGYPSGEDMAFGNAEKFISGLNSRGLLPAGMSARLPSRSEWELACQSATSFGLDDLGQYCAGDNKEKKLEWCSDKGPRSSGGIGRLAIRPGVTKPVYYSEENVDTVRLRVILVEK